MYHISTLNIYVLKSLIELDFHRSWISWDHCIPQTEEHEAVRADIKEAVKADIKHLDEL